MSQKLRATAAEPVCTIATGCPYSTIQPLTVKTFTSLGLDVRRGPWLVFSCSSCPEFSSFGEGVLRSLSYPTSWSVSQVVSVCHGVSFLVLLDLLS